MICLCLLDKLGCKEDCCKCDYSVNNDFSNLKEKAELALFKAEALSDAINIIKLTY